MYGQPTAFCSIGAKLHAYALCSPAFYLLAGENEDALAPQPRIIRAASRRAFEPLPQGVLGVCLLPVVLLPPWRWFSRRDPPQKEKPGDTKASELGRTSSDAHGRSVWCRAGQLALTATRRRKVVRAGFAMCCGAGQLKLPAVWRNQATRAEFALFFRHIPKGAAFLSFILVIIKHPINNKHKVQH